MVLLAEASEEASKAFVMCFLQPFTKFMIGGNEHLLLCMVLLLLDDLLQASERLTSPKDPLKKLFPKMLLVKLSGGMLGNAFDHVLRILKDSWVSSM